VPNLAYSLDDDGEVMSRIATEQEIETARSEARAKLLEDPNAWALRSCWVCNPAHRHFLNDLADGFLIRCFAECGRVYYQGIDVTED
jgi:hypothetical protein